MNNKTKLKLCALGMVGVIGASALSGCVKTVDCNIQGEHAHKYSGGQGTVMFVNSEKETYHGHSRTNEYVLINEDEEKKLKIQNKNDLYPIEENIDYINSHKENYKDYTEYRYYYAYVQRHVHYRHYGKYRHRYYTYSAEIGHSWTDDKNHENLTGETREAHYVFTGYNIEKNEKEKYKASQSREFDSLDELLYNCAYIKDDFFDAVDAANGQKLSYEDGTKESHELPQYIMEEYSDELEKLEEDYAKTLTQ